MIRWIKNGNMGQTVHSHPSGMEWGGTRFQHTDQNGVYFKVTVPLFLGFPISSLWTLQYNWQLRRQDSRLKPGSVSITIPKNTEGNFLTWLLLTLWCFWHFLFSCSTFQTAFQVVLNEFQDHGGSPPTVRRAPTYTICLWPYGPQPNLDQNGALKTGRLLVSVPGLL